MEKVANRDLSKLLRLAIPIAIFVIALGLRLVGIGWGLKNDLHNASYHPDEPDILRASRAIVPAQGQFTPHFYNYGTLYLTILRVASDVTTTYTGEPKVAGGYSASNPDKTDWDWVSRCHLAGRILSALAGAGTALMVFLLGRRCHSEMAGVFGGLLIAFAPAHVVHSRFQTVDIVAAFFLTCSTYYAVLLLPRDGEEKPVNFVKVAGLCGLFAGLSAGTKYTGILALLSLFAAVAISKRAGWAKEALVGVGVGLLTFVVTTPGCILEQDIFITNFVYEMNHTSTGHGLVFAGTSSGFVFHLLNMLLGIGILAVPLCFLGLGHAAFVKHKWVLVLLAFFVPYYLLIGKAEVKFLRYTFPLYTTMAVGFGYAIAEAHRRGGWSRLVVGAGILALGGVPGGGLRGAATMTGWMSSEDPRDEAGKYLKTSGGTVGLASDPWFWSPALFPDAAEPRSVRPDFRMQQLEAQTNPKLVYMYTKTAQLPELTSFDLRLINEAKPDRICFSSLELPMHLLSKDVAVSAQYKGQVDNLKAFIAALEKSYEPEKNFGDDLLGVEDLAYIQPMVYVWKRKGKS